jgi:DNA recombination protein RmuC
MQIAILILLAVVVLVLLWLVLQSQKRTADPTIPLLQQEVMSLRGQLTEAMQRNQETVNQQLGQITTQVNSQLGQVTNQVNQQLGQVTSQVNTQLGQVAQQLQKSTGDLNTRLDNAARVVQEVSKGLGGLSEATKKVFEVGKDIASLQEILRSPKLRGGLGELFLGDLLAQIFPPAHFTLQHRFKSGEAVDAVLRLGRNLVPVDAKFPLENFRRVVETATEEDRKAAKRKFISDVKKHVDAIASKYILPDEGTFDFALMYIPAENVYYELIIRDEAADTDRSLLSYAFAKRVIPVSPNSFYAYLQTILLGLKGLHIEEQTQEILRSLDRLAGDFEKFRADFEVMGKHLTNVRSKYDEADKRLEKFGDRLQSLTGTEPEPMLAETKKLPL